LREVILIWLSLSVNEEGYTYLSVKMQNYLSTEIDNRSWTITSNFSTPRFGKGEASAEID